MNKIYNLKILLFRRIGLFSLLFPLLAIGLMSCENVFDEEENCEPSYYLNFMYNMNMDFADAFPTQVSSILIYIYDKNTGEQVKVLSEAGNILSEENYKIKLDLDPGEYEVIVWGGIIDNEDKFQFTRSVTQKEGLGCIVKRDHTSDGNAFISHQLPSFFHGQMDVTLPDDFNEHIYTVSLIKNTNNVNVTLQDVDGNNINPDRFSISMKIDNGTMAHNNEVLEDEEIEYFPYRKISGSSSIDKLFENDNKNLISSLNDIINVEISTARLISTHNPNLEIIDNDNNKIIYSIPLIKWALMLKSEKYSGMNDQEYLDREDEYNIMVYLQKEGNDNPDIPDDSSQYTAVSIYINGWRIVHHDNTELQ